MNQWFDDITPDDVCTSFHIDRQISKGFISEYLADNVVNSRQYTREPQSNIGIGTNAIATNSGVDTLHILCGAPVSSPNQISYTCTFAKNHPDRVNWVYLLNPLDVPSIKSVIYTIPAEAHALFVLPFARDCVNRSFEIQIQTFWQSTFTIYTGVDTSVLYTETPLKRSLSVNIVCSDTDTNITGVYTPSKNVMTCNDYIGLGPFTVQPIDESNSVAIQDSIYPRGTLKLASDGHRWIVSGYTQMLCMQVENNNNNNGGDSGGNNTSSSSSLYTQVLTTSERLAISAPSQGLAVYDSTVNSMFVFTNGYWAQILEIPSTTSTLTLPGNLVMPSSSSQLGIGTSSPLSCSALQINSTTQGFLPPVLTSNQRTNIVNPANGLQVYDTTINAPYVYSSGTWNKINTFQMPTTTTLTGVIVGDLTTTYNPPAGALYLYVEVFGCGGTGGYTLGSSVGNVFAGGGGGGGGYASFYMSANPFSVKFSANDSTSTTHTTDISSSNGTLLLSVSNGANGNIATYVTGSGGLGYSTGGSGGIVSAYNNFQPLIAANGTPGGMGVVYWPSTTPALCLAGLGGSCAYFGSYSYTQNGGAIPSITRTLNSSVTSAQIIISFGAGSAGITHYSTQTPVYATNPSPGGVIVHEYYC